MRSYQLRRRTTQQIIHNIALNQLDAIAAKHGKDFNTKTMYNEYDVRYVYYTLCPIIKNINHRPMIDSAIAVTRNQIRKGGQDAKMLNAIIKYLKS